jgi:hypothetical protein
VHSTELAHRDRVATGVAGDDLSGLVSLDGTTHTDAGTYAADAWSFAGGITLQRRERTVVNSIAQARTGHTRFRRARAVAPMAEPAFRGLRLGPAAFGQTP